MNDECKEKERIGKVLRWGKRQIHEEREAGRKEKIYKARRKR
jgi:hypothetical protein